MTQAAGKLNHRIRLESLETSQDANGETVETWTHEGDVWANVSPVSGKEFISAAAMQSQIVARITVRYRVDIQATWRILFRNQYYNIEGVLPDVVSGLEYLTLPCSLGIRIYQDQQPEPPFDPSFLFLNGEQGVWFDPSDMSSMFQDAAGTIPVTASGQPVGRILDKSGRGNHATQGAALSRPVYTESGGLKYLVFDGVDDFLVTGSINFTSTDKMTLFAGVRKLSDASGGTIAELSTSVAANNGSFFLSSSALINVDRLTYGLQTRGTTTVASAEMRIFTAPHSAVITGVMNLAATGAAAEIFRRVNGQSPAGVSTGDAGAGNFGNYPIYIGRRAGTSVPFNGHLYGLVVLARSATGTEIGETEQFIASDSGVTLGSTVFSPGTTVDVLLVAGQSNAEGRGSAASSPLVNPNSGGFWSGSLIAPLADPVGGANTGSAWPSAANVWRTVNGRSLLIVEQATGGTGLLPGVGTANWSSSGTLRAPAVTAANAAIANVNADPTLTLGNVYVAWLQGESDADAYNGTTVSAATYQAELQVLFNYFKANITGVDGILVSALGAPNDGVNAANWTLIRNAQIAGVAATVASYIATNVAKDFPAQGKMVDRLHYNQTGLNEIGTNLATYSSIL